MRKIDIFDIFETLYEYDSEKKYTLSDAIDEMKDIGYNNDEINSSLIGLTVKYYVDENDQLVGGGEIIFDDDEFDYEELDGYEDE